MYLYEQTHHSIQNDNVDDKCVRETTTQQGCENQPKATRFVSNSTFEYMCLYLLPNKSMKNLFHSPITTLVNVNQYQTSLKKILNILQLHATF